MSTLTEMREGDWGAAIAGAFLVLAAAGFVGGKVAGRVRTELEQRGADVDLVLRLVPGGR